METGRNSDGTFAPGHTFKSPGRPRRAVEVEYLRALSDEVTTDDWKEIVAKAKEQAKAGDAKAREWLAGFVIGKEPPALTELALMDVHEASVDDWLDSQANAVEYLNRGLAGEAVKGKKTREIREQAMAELEAQRQRREAAKLKRQAKQSEGAE